MGNFREILGKISLIVNMLADLFLILAGLVLICWACISVDVLSARYLLIAAGTLLFAFGCWFRYLSWKKQKSRGEG